MSLITNKKIKVRGQDFNFNLKRKARVRYMRLTIEPSGLLTVSAPKTYPLYLIKKFIEDRWDWIQKNLRRVIEKASLLGNIHSPSQIKAYSRMTRRLVEQRLLYFNQSYGFKIGRISIRNQKSRWGSCSSQGNLNFNYRLCLLPSELSDYIIVHELCHLGQLNHSPQFWQLVGRTIEDYRQREISLNNI